MVDKTLRQFYRKQMKKLARVWEKAEALAKVAAEASVGSDPESEVYHRAWATRVQMKRARYRYWKAEGLIWGRIKRQAIERAVGI